MFIHFLSFFYRVCGPSPFIYPTAARKKISGNKTLPTTDPPDGGESTGTTFFISGNKNALVKSV